MDVWTCTASILHLVAISMDRWLRNLKLFFFQTFFQNFVQKFLFRVFVLDFFCRSFFWRQINHFFLLLQFRFVFSFLNKYICLKIWYPGRTSNKLSSKIIFLQKRFKMQVHSSHTPGDISKHHDQQEVRKEASNQIVLNESGN